MAPNFVLEEADTATQQALQSLGPLDHLLRIVGDALGAALSADDAVASLFSRALAIEVAHRQSWRYPAGILWLDCRGGPALDTLLDQIGAFCGLDNLAQTPPAEKATVVRAALARLEERCLLIWDNAEDIWAEREIRTFLRQQLPANCQLLLTTRDDPDEAMWPTLELPRLADSAMATLFRALASAAQVRVGSQADLDLIGPMLAWLEGHPLAVTLLVPLAKRRGLRAVWADLQRRPLKGIDAAFAVSYDRLTAPQQQLFTRLSVFTIPFERDAGAALVADVADDSDVVEHSDVEDELDILQQRALLQWTGERCTFHALLRQFVYSRLQAREADLQPIHRLAAEYLRGKLTDQERGGTPEEALEEVDQWERAAAWETFARRAGALVGSLDRLGYWSEIEERLVRSESALSDNDDNISLTAQILNDRGAIANKQARWNEAIVCYKQALQKLKLVDDLHSTANTLNNLGAAYQSKGEWDQCIVYCEQSLQMFEQLENSHDKASIYNNLGLAYERKGEWNKSIEYYKQALQIFEQASDIDGIARTCNNLGNVYESKGNWDEAIEFYKRDLEISNERVDIHGMAQTYNNLGVVFLNKAEWDKSFDHHMQALKIRENMGDMHGIAETYNNLGCVYQGKREWDNALKYHEQALQILEQLSNDHGVSQTYINLGRVYDNKGASDRSVSYTKLALQISQKLGDEYGMAQAYNNLGIFYYCQSLQKEAARYMTQAFLMFRRLGAAETQQVANNVVKLLGSPEAAQAYVDEFVAAADGEAAA